MKGFMRIVLIIVVAGAISSGGAAWGTIITVEVGGVVDFFRTEGGFALDGSVGVGSEMAGFVSYNTDTPDLDSSEEHGVYTVISISMSIGNYTFTADPGASGSPHFRVGTVDPTYAGISPDPRFDGTITVTGTPQTYEDITWGWTRMELFDLWTSEPEYIPTDALPDLDSWPELSVFDNRREFLVSFNEPYGSNGSFDIMGEITSLNVVPEPGTVLLLGLGGLVLVRRQRH